MSENDWEEVTHHASRSEARRLLAQIEADERFGVVKVIEIFNSFEVRSLAQLRQELLPEFIDVCKRILKDKFGI